MAEVRVESSGDEGLQQLLGVEERLQRLVRAARDEAAALVAAARETQERRLTVEREAAERADAERARAERLAHEQALAEIDAAHRAALEAIASVSDSRVDELARHALAAAIGVTGEPA
jgi:uncharacterized protein YaiL (DUF2058 family)